MPDPEGAFFPDGQPRPPIVVDPGRRPTRALIAEAVAGRRAADYVVVVVGDRIELIGEGKSTATLELQSAARSRCSTRSPRPARRWSWC